MSHHDHRHIRRADHPHMSTPAPSQYWVVGGEFSDTEFKKLEGAAQAFGPFADYGHAYREWERRSLETRPNAHMRFTIVGSLAR